jgi:TPP-dependent pyruvate/acetoin dehydrogenase alpha subunit
MGRATGITRGRDGNVHFGDRAPRLRGDGVDAARHDARRDMAMAFKLRGERRCALTWLGDGATSRGDFHEAMNWTAVQRLPVIFVLENNQYAYSTALALKFAVDPLERAAA